LKFLRITNNNITTPAVEVDNVIYDISPLVADISNQTIEKLLSMDIDINTLKKVEKYERIETPITGISKIICIGLNYVDHAKESGMKIPSEPVVFMKAISSITGPNDNVEIPRNSVKTDWEVELGVVIGKRAKYVQQQDAYDYIAGYTIINDISEREFQLEREGQWSKGKSHDTFSPIGPYLVTKDEVDNEDSLSMTLSVDGKIFQNGNTNTMFFKVPFIISYLSNFMTLLPGDIVSTGTPPGVGFGQKPEVYLKEGQTMKLTIEKLGTQRQVTVSL
jgi:2-keto-4-pentenoate hydratase/2-oxohepta-3-ene-1,7-dioic acid hydratase in catechol pathway|tara:strand:+ start:1313 stop:2143 length:831 start_codon:yes stop_codon:yes gene_type:complete